VNDQGNSPSAIGRPLTTYELWYGRNEPPPLRTALRAGPLTALLEGADIRDIRFAGVELVRRIYVALRDENWDTVPAKLTNLRADVREDSFLFSFDARHCNRDIDFRWHATIQGDPEARISYTLDGQALRDFRYCRIGFCVLQPPAEYAGRPYCGITPDGPITGELPMTIGPQRYEGGCYFPLFPAVSSLNLSLRSGVEVRFDFEGDLFEMEDQRNWTDGSFKTYCTPLSLGYPHTATAGQAFTQRVSITPIGDPTVSVTANNEVRLSVGPPTGGTLPRLGLGVATQDASLTSVDKELLRPLHLDHLRVDLHLSDSEAMARLTRAERDCGSLGCALELALFLTDNADQELRALSARLSLPVPVARVFVFHEKEQSTSQQWVQLVRDRIASHLPEVPIGGGTNLYFAELNRSRPVMAGFDVVVYPVNPQVHASDERSLVENLEAQYDTLLTARTFCGDIPLAVSPVTLKPRFNPDAVGSEPPVQAGELPSAVDPRQMSLFAAAWTLASIKQLAEGCAASVTYYETTGWRGIKDTDRGSPNPGLFPSAPDLVFPVYHVFSHIADLKVGQLLKCESSDPLRVQALAIQIEGHLHLLVANLTPEAQTCAIEPVTNDPVQVLSLDASNALIAMSQPLQFRAATQCVWLPAPGALLKLTLAPYSVVRVDPPETSQGGR
jgi:hypothetical protein